MEPQTANYAIHQGNSLEIMRSMAAESVDCVITDPPYLGFGFVLAPKRYWNSFAPYYEEMLRLCQGRSKRLAISQPPPRHEYFREKMVATSIIKIQNGFADERGIHAFFLTVNALLDQPQSAENWPVDIVPPSIHPNDRDVNKMAIVVKAMSKDGDTVLDPFCGSAAIGVACLLLGRRYIGIELVNDRANDARTRLQAVRTSK